MRQESAMSRKTRKKREPELQDGDGAEKGGEWCLCVCATAISENAPSGASNGDLWWDTHGTLDAWPKVRVSGSWVSVAVPRKSARTAERCRRCTRPDCAGHAALVRPTQPVGTGSR